MLSIFVLQVQRKLEDEPELCKPDNESVPQSTGPSATNTPTKLEADLIGTPLECPFDLNVLKIKDDEFYSKETMESRHHSELKSCSYVPFSSFEARYQFIRLMPSNKVVILLFSHFQRNSFKFHSGSFIAIGSSCVLPL